MFRIYPSLFKSVFPLIKKSLTGTYQANKGPIHCFSKDTNMNMPYFKKNGIIQIEHDILGNNMCSRVQMNCDKTIYSYGLGIHSQLNYSENNYQSILTLSKLPNLYIYEHLQIEYVEQFARASLTLSLGPNYKNDTIVYKCDTGSTYNWLESMKNSHISMIYEVSKLLHYEG